MIQQDKELLIQYLSAALPYKVVIDYSYNAFKMDKGNYKSYIKQGSKCLLDCDLLDVFISPRQNEKGEYIKPYLRPLSSITDEEYKIYHELIVGMFETGVLNNFEILLDFFNSHHFDYRGLIKKGLALEAPEGMYNS